MHHFQRSILLLLFVAFQASAQAQGEGNPQRGAFRVAQANNGRFYGKVLDSLTEKPVEFAAIQLFGNKFDTASRSFRYSLLTGALTQSNGDFSLDNLPVSGEFTIKISAIGYTTYEKKISFRGPGPSGKEGGTDAPAVSRTGGSPDKDLGNIRLAQSSIGLAEVTVQGETPAMEIKLDKRVFNVEKNLTSAGGTGEDVLKNVPSVNVDMDGNITLRNASPQLFVDGKPTTLTADQIPADAIQQVEVISNPSAKYDASGGTAGIINIVLKKNRRIGYNGSVRLNGDSRGRLGGGVDLNAREGKLNVFANINVNQRRSKGTTASERRNLTGPPLYTTQVSPTSMEGLFGFGRFGFDYFMSNRNTLTFSQQVGRGSMENMDDLTTRTDTLLAPPVFSSLYKRMAVSGREFTNTGTALLFKHLFPQEGKEFTADVNYNGNKSTNTGNFETQYYGPDDTPYGTKIQQQQTGASKTGVLTAQADFVLPLPAKSKVETGARTSVRNFSSKNENFILDSLSHEFVILPLQTMEYMFNDQVYALYGTYSREIKKITYQTGLRIESSFYHGKLLTTSRSFKNEYPFSFFPSAFLTYRLNEKSDLQLNFTRRINRPNFFQLIPFTDYSDSLNLRRGNPALKPEFTNSLELNYLKTFSRSDNVLFSMYVRNTTDLITSYQETEYDSTLKKNVVIITSENANSSYMYGAEFTARKSVKKWIELMFQVDLYNAVINGTNLQSDLRNEQFTWTSKLNITFKLPKQISLQLNGDYRSKTALSSGRGMGRWGGGMWGMPGSTVQGYVRPMYWMDLALRKEFLKNNAAALSISFSDILKTRVSETYSESPYFIQETKRIRDQQFVRVSFSYRFGKFDASLFKRKNTRVTGEDTEVPINP